MKNLMILLIFLCSEGFSSFWMATSKYTQPDENGRVKSVLILSKDDQELKYLPPYPPFGLTSIHRFSFNNKLYFLTVWPNGPKTFIHRVFSPNNHTNKQLNVICHAGTSSEEPKMNLLTDKSVAIERQLFDEKQEKVVSIWEKCGVERCHLVINFRYPY